MMEELNGLYYKAIDQFYKEFDELCNDTKNQRFIESAMRLRNLTEMQKYTLLQLLVPCINKDMEISRFRTIVNSNEFITVPRDISAVISDLWWAIDDDGYAALIRAEIWDDWEEKSGGKVKGGRGETVFFIDNVGSMETVEAVNTVLKYDYTYFINPKIRSLKVGCFHYLDDFADLLDILGNSENYDKYENIIPERIDERFFSDKAHSLVRDIH